MRDLRRVTELLPTESSDRPVGVPGLEPRKTIRRTANLRVKHAKIRRFLIGGGHGARTRNPLRGTTFPVWPLAIRLPSRRIPKPLSYQRLCLSQPLFTGLVLAWCYLGPNFAGSRRQFTSLFSLPTKAGRVRVNKLQHVEHADCFAKIGNALC